MLPIARKYALICPNCGRPIRVPIAHGSKHCRARGRRPPVIGAWGLPVLHIRWCNSSFSIDGGRRTNATRSACCQSSVINERLRSRPGDGSAIGEGALGYSKALYSCELLKDIGTVLGAIWRQRRPAHINRHGLCECDFAFQQAVHDWDSRLAMVLGANKLDSIKAEFLFHRYCSSGGVPSWVMTKIF